MSGAPGSGEGGDDGVRVADVKKQQAHHTVVALLDAHHSVGAALAGLTADGCVEADVAGTAVAALHRTGHLLVTGHGHHVGFDHGDDALVGDGIDGLLLQQLLVQIGTDGHRQRDADHGHQADQDDPDALIVRDGEGEEDTEGKQGHDGGDDPGHILGDTVRGPEELRLGGSAEPEDLLVVPQSLLEDLFHKYVTPFINKNEFLS